ncbi:unnamed protein product [Gongylonema pulchrum]|uniref:Intraflagellar transport protein 52 homolog n=1 Tax=Gongylonema pulchrum TaxID=637853 RepID=A0A183DH66_9BILA|nr:unnamed protein product [Gongylonema pulchrum]
MPKGRVRKQNEELNQPIDFNLDEDFDFEENFRIFKDRVSPDPFPEVTDQICRFPLPTLFYRLQAIHLGDLLRISV